MDNHLTHLTFESRRVVYGPENGYDFPYPSLLRVKLPPIHTECLRKFLSVRLVVHVKTNNSSEIKKNSKDVKIRLETLW